LLPLVYTFFARFDENDVTPELDRVAGAWAGEDTGAFALTDEDLLPEQSTQRDMGE